MKKFTYRRWQGFLTLLTLFVSGSSLYFQYHLGMQPCPLCLMQRFCVFLLLLFCLMGLYAQTQRVGKILACLQFLVAAGGLFFASRQLWLQSLPAGETPSCMPGLDVLIRFFPWQDVVRALFLGTGECAENSWQWLGLSMPAWAALYFLFMLIAAILIYWRLGKDPL
jgi:protein dithiol:quinone oxidoreductase